MGQLVLGGVGAAIGFAIGGPVGAQYGFGIGSTIGGTLFAPDLPDSSVEGPRLQDLSVYSDGTHGSPIPRIWGIGKVPGRLIYAAPIREKVITETQTAGGKGGGGRQTQTRTTYEYYGSFAYALCASDGSALITRLWANGVLVLDTISGRTADPGQVGNEVIFNVYRGGERNTRIPSDVRVAVASFVANGGKFPDNFDRSVFDNFPAHKDLLIVSVENLLLGYFGNQIPGIEAEVILQNRYSVSTPSRIVGQTSDYDETTLRFYPVIDFATSTVLIFGPPADVNTIAFPHLASKEIDRSPSFLALNNFEEINRIQILELFGTLPNTVYFNCYGAIRTTTGTKYYGAAWKFITHITNIGFFEHVSCEPGSSLFVETIVRPVRRRQTNPSPRTYIYGNGYVAFNAGGTKIIELSAQKDPYPINDFGDFNLLGVQSIDSDYVSYEHISQILFAIARTDTSTLSIKMINTSMGDLFNVNIVTVLDWSPLIEISDLPDLSPGSSFVTTNTLIAIAGVYRYFPDADDSFNFDLLTVVHVLDGTDNKYFVVNCAYDGSSGFSFNWAQEVSGMPYGIDPLSAFPLYSINGISKYGLWVFRTRDNFVLVNNGLGTVIEVAIGTDIGVYSRGQWYNGNTNILYFSRRTSVTGPYRLMGVNFNFDLDVSECSSDSTTIASICNDLLLESGIQESEFEIDEVSSAPFLGGMVSLSPTSNLGLIERLRVHSDFDVLEEDAKIKIIKRYGKTAIVGIRLDAFLSDVEAIRPYQITRTQDSELPRLVNVQYIDREREYQAETQDSVRMRYPVSVMRSQTSSSFRSPIVMSPNYAKFRANALLYQAWNERLFFTFRLPLRYIYLSAGDTVVILLDGSKYFSLKLTKISIGLDLSLDCSGVWQGGYGIEVDEDLGIIGTFLKGNVPVLDYCNPRIARPLGEIPRTVIPIPDIPARTDDTFITIVPDVGDDGALLDSEIEAKYVVGAFPIFFDIPFLADDHAGSTTLLNQEESIAYWAAISNAYSTVNLRSTLYGTLDEASWNILSASTMQISSGRLQQTLGNPASYWRTDEENTILCSLTSGSAPDSVTQLEMLNGENFCVIVKDNGEIGIIQYRSVLEVGNNYQLSGLLRGRRGSEKMDRDYSGYEKIYFLTSSTVQYINILLEHLDINLLYRLVETGGSLETSLDSRYTHTGRNFKPYAPVHLNAVVSEANSNIVFSWVRRTRLGGALRNSDGTVAVDVPLSEETERYVFEVLDSDGDVVYTRMNLESPTTTITFTELADDVYEGSVPVSTSWRVAQIGQRMGFYSEIRTVEFTSLQTRTHQLQMTARYAINLEDFMVTVGTQ